MSKALALWHNGTTYYASLYPQGGSSSPSTPATQKLPRNLSVKHNNLEITTIDPADLPIKTDASGQYLIFITFDGDGELWLRWVTARTGEIYMCTVEGANNWLLDLRKNNSPTGTIQIMIPETDTYQSATWTLTVGA